MAKKKNKKNPEIFDHIEVEPVEGNVPETEAILDESESTVSDASPQDGNEAESEAVKETLDDVPSEDDEEISADDLLDDVRRSLIEENTKIEEEKKPSWWQKLGVGKQKEKASDASAPVVEPQEEPDQVVLDEVVVEPVADMQADAGESIDDLIEMLATDEDDVSSEAEGISVDIGAEQPKVEKVSLGELKKRAFRRSEPDDVDQDFSDVRAVALDGDDGEEVFVEIEVKAEDPLEDRIKSLENALKPYRRYIYFGIAFIGVVVIAATFGLLYGAYEKSLPPEPTKEVSNLPYPVMLRMPGDLSFNLGRGSLEDGRWNPRYPEWLEGTEVCRWVAIRYSRQLEAVIRTLTQDDQLELVMSNSDVLTYNVYSIMQMSIEDMQAVSSNSSCLLLVLADATTDTRWVVTAYP